MVKSTVYELGIYCGRRYFLRGEPSPGYHTPEDFVVTIFYADATSETRVEVARIDTAHGFTHFDKLYRPDQPKEPVDLDFWEALAFLQGNWRTYAEMHHENVDDGTN